VLAEIALPPIHGMPRDLWRWAIAVNDIADISTPAKLVRLDLLPLAPSRRNWLPFQAMGEQLHSEGYRGVLYPSAACPCPDHQALCLFREGIVILGADPLRPPTTHRDPPAPPNWDAHLRRTSASAGSGASRMPIWSPDAGCTRVAGLRKTRGLWAVAALQASLPHSFGAEVAGPEDHVAGGDREQHEHDTQPGEHRFGREQTIDDPQAGWPAAGDP
jgi:RES domain